MKVSLLRVNHFRCFDDARFAPGSGLNWLVGANGAGKTSLLEAAYMLSHGRSFRAGGRTAPCQHGSHNYLIHAGLARHDRCDIRLGLARDGDRWQGRLDGKDLSSLAPLFKACPVVYFGPDSQTMVTGPAEERRSFLDWSVFHVEHASLDTWRAWRRALRQRNALLRSGAPDAEFDPWERALAQLADQIHEARTTCLGSLKPYLVAEVDALVPELGAASVDYRAGWDVVHGLRRQLADQRNRDRERGFTQAGAQRADWSLRFAGVAQKEHLSRGQAKAIALACMLAQTRWLQEQIGEFPLLCLDDLESELDPEHVGKVITWLAGRAVQVWLTNTVVPASMPDGTAVSVFHVEHSGVRLDAAHSVG